MKRTYGYSNVDVALGILLGLAIGLIGASVILLVLWVAVA